MYLYKNDGTVIQSVEDNYKPEPDEVASHILLTEDEILAKFPKYAVPSKNKDLMAQIRALEATVTNRRMREAHLGKDGGWLENIDDQITTLRNQIK